MRSNQENQSGNLVPIKEQVNLLEYPDKIRKHPDEAKNTELTIGDLHGNALKLIHFLIRENVLSLSPVDYEKLVVLYQKNVHEITSGDIDSFNAIISSAKVANPAKIRLIGDELADRGSNDYFTLKILEKLGKEKLDVGIIFSNHGGEFLRSYESLFSQFNSDLSPGQAASLNNLEVLINNGLVKENLLDLVDQYYKPNIKILDYSLTADNEISLYTHAPVGLNTIQALAKELNVVYTDQTPQDLARTIDRINQSAAAIPDIFNRSKYDKVKYEVDSAAASLDFPLVRMMWTRRSDSEHAQLNNLIDPMQPENHSYKIRYIHGHDGKGVSIHPDYVTNLDNMLGILPNLRFYSGEYAIEAVYNTVRPQPLNEIQPELSNTIQASPKDSNIEEKKTEAILELQNRILQKQAIVRDAITSLVPHQHLILG